MRSARTATGALLCVAVLVLGACLAGAGLRAGPHRNAGHARHVTLAAVGDIFFARGVAKQIARRGPDYPFSATRDTIRSADLAFCNLECCLSRRGVCQRRRFRFRADPDSARTLADAGFDFASLANNHTLDYGRVAMLDTVVAVRRAGMTPVGAGPNRREALRVRVVTVHGLRVGFVAYTDIPTVGVVRLDDKPTIAGANLDQLAGQIREAKRRCDVLLVSFHWGVEYMKRPTERQRALARACIDNGADAILGHHPHVLQTVETYRRKPIIYSMGAFVWDAKVFGADRSAIYLLDLAPSSARLAKTVPVRITNYRPSAD